MLAAVGSATLNGALGRRVSVEVHVSNGLPGFTIVGLPDAAVREARDRVRAAVLSCGLPWPLRRVTVNLAPSGVRKGGAGLDLPIAVGLLVATGEISPASTEGLAFCGELGLNGALRRVPGVIALADATAPSGLVVPLCDLREAALVRGAGPRGGHADRAGSGAPGPIAMAATTTARADRERGRSDTRPGRRARPDARSTRPRGGGGRPAPSLEIGPPGSGKTMLAERLPGLLPPLSPEEALTVTRVDSAAGCALPAGAARRPRSSIVSLVGGGSWSLRPGEVSLATPRVRECPLTKSDR